MHVLSFPLLLDRQSDTYSLPPPDVHHPASGPSRSGKERRDGGAGSTFLGRAPPPRGSIYTTMERGDPVELARALPPTPAAMGAVLPTSKDFLPRKLRVKTFRHTAVPSRHYKVH